MITDLVAVAIGGAFGALARFGLLRVTDGRAREARGSWDGASRGTFLANVLGCLAFGLWAASGADAELPGLGALDPEAGFALDLLILTGFCGGLTTFSTLVSDGVRLRAVRGRRASLGYAAATFGVGLVALWLGLRFGA